jgi:glutamate-1-semialdehyde 2,1-aminomutase
VIDRAALARLTEAELDRFAATHPLSRELFARAQRSLVGGVPMPWMMMWAGGFPPYVASAKGASLTDVDGCDYVDLCLADTGAMTGHGPPAVREQCERGMTTMLPTEDSILVAEELARRFGLGRWLFTLSATDANRSALRIARQVTGRGKVLVFSYCYHGSVDESFAVRGPDGGTVSRAGNAGPPVDPALTTVAVEFNDTSALEAALADRSVACVLAEPAMTNMGIILPAEGYHRALRETTRDTGTLLIIDETHTLSAGPGGCTAAWGLVPDMVTVGKAIGGGIACGALGLSGEVSTAMLADPGADYEDTGGIGGTLAGNALSLAAMRATLTHVLTADAYSRTVPLAGRFADGVRGVIETAGLGWHVTQLGCRAEYRFQPEPPQNGTQASAASDAELERYFHLHAMNRGVLITPFHNMALMSPVTRQADVDRHTEVFAEAVSGLLGLCLTEPAGARVALASVHHYVGAGDPGRTRGQQEHDHVGDLFQAAEAPEWKLGRNELGEGLGVVRAEGLPRAAREEDGARADRVHPDAGRGQFLGRRRGEVDLGRLGHRVRGPRRRAYPGDRGDDHAGSPARGLEEREPGPDQLGRVPCVQ